MHRDGTHESPRVSVVMPVLDEADHIEDSLAAIARQTYPAELLEIFAIDGGSRDGTAEILARHAAVDPRLRVLGGPGVNTPSAMNIGIQAATGDYVAKVDCHGWISDDFLEQAVWLLEDDPAVACVGGEIVPVASTSIQLAISIARFSRLGVGVGIYTAPPIVHDIDTVQCGVYRRAVLEAVGRFDPELQFGEDEEVNHRIRIAGHRIAFQPAMRFHYHVRPSLRSLFRQYLNYGRARVRVVRKHPGFLRLKHLVPAAVVMALVVAIPLWVFVHPVGAVLLACGYLAVLAGGSLMLAIRHKYPRPHLIAAGLACLHLGYGLGTLAGLADMLRPRR